MHNVYVLPTVSKRKRDDKNCLCVCVRCYIMNAAHAKANIRTIELMTAYHRRTIDGHHSEEEYRTFCKYAQYIPSFGGLIHRQIVFDIMCRSHIVCYVSRLEWPLKMRSNIYVYRPLCHSPLEQSLPRHKELYE